MDKHFRLWTAKVCVFTIITIIVFAGCTKTTATVLPLEAEPEEPSGDGEQISEPVVEDEAGTAPDAAAPSLAAFPMRIQFTAEDGQKLVGHYFAAKNNPAPTVILMHWYPGDQRDWLTIAPWMQNRQDELAESEGWEMAIGLDCGAQQEGPWLDPSWFPPMPEDISFNVFIFDFRGHCESKSANANQEDKPLDAKAAFAEVSLMETTDPDRIVAIGASIGADGAADGCLLHNQESTTCLGAFSLSPGSYLGLEYADVVRDLVGAEVTPIVPAWCLASEEDIPSLVACDSAFGDDYHSFLYEGDAHGMELITPSSDPNPLILIQDFLEETFGVEIN
jgi:pimeloyl-ACP methyl ester carboxylesterase